MLLEPGLESLDVAVALVLVALLVVLGVESEGGVATDGQALDLVGGGVELGNHEVLVVGVRVSELLPHGGEGLAVAAPGSVVLDEHVLGGVVHNRVEVGANEDGQGTLGLGLGLRLEVGSQVAGLELVNVVLDGVHGEGVEGSGVNELLHVLAGMEQADSGGVGAVNTDELGETLLNALLGAGGNKEDLALELLGSLSKDLVVGSGVVVGEEDESLTALAEDRLNVVLAELNKGRDRSSLHPVAEGSLVVLAVEVDGGLVEGAEDADAVGLGVVGSSALTGSVVEREGIGRSGNLHEAVEEFALKATEVDHVQLVAGNLSDDVVTGELDRNGAGLLVDPLDDGVLGAATGVVLLFSVDKEDQGGEALDLEALSESVVLSSVDLGDVLGGILLFELLGRKSVFRGQFLAVSTPGGVELDKQMFVF